VEEAGPATEIDQPARAAAVAIAGARLGIGIATFGFARRALPLVGVAEPGAAAITFARMAGGRDLALGLHALSAAGDRERLREATLIGALVDAGDAIAFGAGFRGDAEARRVARRNAPLGALAAIVGVWILSRL
jgi:hypothetical protein